MKATTIVFDGPPGSGKGTQAERLAHRLGWPHVDVGALLRKRSQNAQDELGKSIAATMRAGKLVEHATVARVVKEDLPAEATQGLVLDGFVRQLPQAEVLVEWVEAGLLPPVLVVELMVDESELIQRIERRRYCADCRAATSPVEDAKEATACLRCGGHLVKREDDTAEAMVERLKVYHRDTKPAAEWLVKKAQVVRVPGMASIDEVAKLVYTAVVERL